ncbi:MAG: type II toxin-antitoxin system RelE/ParE family toxin [Candidatus Gracilibacteria bacterium]
MMIVTFTDRFRKRLKKLPAKIQKQFELRLEIFVTDSKNPILKVHPLRGNLIGRRAFSITGDYRVIYRVVDEESVKLVDIGTHSQIY